MLSKKPLQGKVPSLGDGLPRHAFGPLHPMMLDAKDLGAGTAAAVLYAASTSSYPRKMFKHATVRMLCIMLIQDE